MEIILCDECGKPNPTIRIGNVPFNLNSANIDESANIHKVCFLRALERHVKAKVPTFRINKTRHGYLVDI